MADLERRYADKPVHFFHVHCGENATQAVDFKKHYRSEATHLLDPTYGVSRAYKAESWPTTIIVDAEGQIAGKWVGLSERANFEAAIRTLDGALNKAMGGPPKGSYCTGNKCYIPKESDVYELHPAMTKDFSGRIHLVYTRENAGLGDIFHMVKDGGSWSEPKRITRSAADDYGPALCSDLKGGVRLAWCSNRSASGKYDIWTKRFDGTVWSAADRVTESDDDAAHPRCSVDTTGNFWITYYRWVPWSKTLSRDREIFARYNDGNEWSTEIQISPSDVPRYEDHADPSIAADARGNVWVAWAWDTHPDADKGWTYPATFGSAIFARQLRAGMLPSRVQMIAIRADSIQAARRRPTWAFLPEVSCVDGKPWFVFESHSPKHGEHACAVTSYGVDGAVPAPTRLGINDTFVCSPKLVAPGDGTLTAIWSAPEQGRYAIYAAQMDKAGNWGAERKVWSTPKADLRFPSAVFDSEGTLWIAASRITERESRVAVQRVELQ